MLECWEHWKEERMWWPDANDRQANLRHPCDAIM